MDIGQDFDASRDALERARATHRGRSTLRAGVGFALALLLSGCTVVGHQRVEGWPALKVALHVVPMNVMRDRCAKYVPPLFSPDGCAEFDLRAGTCNIWIADGPNNQSHVEHELLHCVGYDHPAGGTLRKALEAYRVTDKTLVSRREGER